MSTSELNGIKLNLIDWINQLSDKNVISLSFFLPVNKKKMTWNYNLKRIGKTQQ